MIKLAPSILSADFANLQRDIETVEKAGAEYLHIDVMDGHFVPNITIGPPVVKSLRKISRMFFDVHLMIENPELYIKDFVDSGADIITVHAEATYHLHRLVQQIKGEGVKAGVVLNPATPINVLEHIIKNVDMVLLMSVNPGFGGQKFIEACYDKIKAVRELALRNELELDIEVDGGVGLENIRKVAQSGANIIVAGSAVFNTKDIQGTIAEMKRLCEGI